MCRHGDRYFLWFFNGITTDPIGEKKSLSEGLAERQFLSSALGSAQGFLSNLEAKCLICLFPTYELRLIMLPLDTQHEGSGGLDLAWKATVLREKQQDKINRWTTLFLKQALTGQSFSPFWGTGGMKARANALT